MPLLGGADQDLVLWSRDRRCQPGGGCNGGCAVPHRDQGPDSAGFRSKTIFGWKNMGILVGIMWRLELLFGHPGGNRKGLLWIMSDPSRLVF